MMTRVPEANERLAYGQRTARESDPGRRSWGTTLILACLALGFVTSAVEFERVQLKGERDRAGMLGAEDSKAEGQLEDLGKFLAEPQTRVIRLTVGESSPIMNAAVAWNGSQEKGYLLCGELGAMDPAVMYELWVRHGTEEPMKIAGIEAKAGVSVYPFRASGVKSQDRLEIMAGPGSAGKSPILSGEFD